jgi:aldose 1-epimerase
LSQAVTLRWEGAEASLLPHLGGAVRKFTVGRRDVLRPTSDHAADPLETACFPLVPYANRIADGRFTFAGRSYAFPPNHSGFPQPLHGLGWVKSWMIAERTDSTAVLTCSHRADEHWPWDWSAMQHFELSGHALRIRLELANTSAQAMPAGLGLHPYFVRRPNDMLQFEAAGLWHNDDAMLPAGIAPAGALGDFIGGAVPASQALIDNCYYGWAGTANWGEGITLRAQGSSFLHVFAPPGEDFICIEPTSQMPDAVNQPVLSRAGGTVLAPGATQKLDLEISVRL